MAIAQRHGAVGSKVEIMRSSWLVGLLEIFKLYGIFFRSSYISNARIFHQMDVFKPDWMNGIKEIITSFLKAETEKGGCFLKSSALTSFGFSLWRLDWIAGWNGLGRPSTDLNRPTTGATFNSMLARELYFSLYLRHCAQLQITLF